MKFLYFKERNADKMEDVSELRKLFKEVNFKKKKDRLTASELHGEFAQRRFSEKVIVLDGVTFSLFVAKFKDKPRPMTLTGFINKKYIYMTGDFYVSKKDGHDYVNLTEEDKEIFFKRLSFEMFKDPLGWPRLRFVLKD